MDNKLKPRWDLHFTLVGSIRDQGTAHTPRPLSPRERGERTMRISNWLRFRNHTPRLFVKVTILALLVVVMLACGPADQSVQREIGNFAGAPQDSDPDTTPNRLQSPRPLVPKQRATIPNWTRF